MTAAGIAGGREPVAIVGIGCRFPGGIVDAQGFWRFLSEGQDAIAEIPPDRIDLGRYFDPRPATPGRIMTRWGGFLDRIEDFDAYFFRLSPREAERLDPQHRLLLEVAWEALEDAGQDTVALEESRTGVFVGQWLQDFEGRLFADPDDVDFYMTTGSGRYAACGRISYLLGLRGPSLSIDSACSSSLAAVHLAVQSIRNGESQLALAGGVNVIMQPHISIAYSQSRMMAPDGRCKFADASGDGYVRSEGAALVVLKPLARAIDDGDRIYALIHGSAINNDGRSSGSMGTPSREGQEDLLRTAYRDAGVCPGGVGYIEAHGTGTRAGDPVELGALGAVLSEGRQDGQRCQVGSVKTNIGHTEGAAGVAGLIKAALATHHAAIPASLHCREPNPAVPWAASPLEVPRSLAPWPVAGGTRFAGVSAFGIAGTNAHVVLGSAPEPASVPAGKRMPEVVAGMPAAVAGAALLPLSARTPEALRALAGRYAGLLREGPRDSLRKVCWNAATRRTALESRAAFVAASTDEMVDVLERAAAGEAPPLAGLARPGIAPRIAFIVPGQGAQWIGMGRSLAAQEPSFRLALERCDRAAREFVPWSITQQLLLDPTAEGYLLDRIDVIQPVLVALAIAYAALWQSRGVEPQAIVGHSMGEVGAACIAGALSLSQAMRIVCRRSALMRTVAGAGAMALVELSLEDVQRRLRGREQRIAAAVSNSPRSSVISGDPRSVQELMLELEHEQVFCRAVNVDVASHSPQMQPLAAELARELAGMPVGQESMPIYSTVLGRRAAANEFDGSYWGRNLRQPVLFKDAVASMLSDGVTAFIELGPHPVLLPSVQQTARFQEREVLTVASGLRERPDDEVLLAGLGELWAHGFALDWRLAMAAAADAAFVALPFYPWQRERHWLAAVDRSASRQLRVDGAAGIGTTAHPLFGPGIAVGGNPPGWLWDLDLNVARLPHLGAHRLHGAAVLAASVYVELAVAAARTLAGGEPVKIESLTFEQAVYLQPDAAARVRLQALPVDDEMTLAWHSEVAGAWTRHAFARIARPRLSTAADARADASAGARADAAASCRTREDDDPAGAGAVIGSDGFYTGLERRGVFFDAALRAIDRVRDFGDCAMADLSLPEAQTAAGARFAVAPALLDACFQLAASLAPEGALWIPSSIGRIECSYAAEEPRRIVARRTSGGASGAITLDVELRGAGGPLLVLGDLRLEKLGGDVSAGVRKCLFKPAWKPQERRSSAPAPAQRRWLLIAEDDAFAREVAARLERAGTPVTVLPADAAAADAVATDGGAPDAGAPLLHATLHDDRTRALEVLYLAAACSEPSDAICSLQRAIRLIQVLARFEAAPRRCWFVTRGAHVTTEDDAGCAALAQAPLWGLGAAVAVEHPSLWGGCIELDPATPAGESAACLIDEVRAGAGEDVAYRDGQRLGRFLVDDGGDHQGGAARLVANATYLLTGGLGGIGLRLAEWLIARGARRLAILGRTQLPARSHWAAIDGHSPHHALVGSVRRLERLGASVHYAALDLADAGQLAAFLESFRNEGWPAIKGVFHLAGSIEDRLIADLDPGSLRRVMAGKALGAWHLDRLLPQLEHFVLFSSVASLLPQPGQASYAAANAFLDALAHCRRARGQAALSVNWPVWQGVGFAATAGGAEALRHLERLGIEALSPDAGLRAFETLVEGGGPQFAILPLDRTRLRAGLADCNARSRALLAPLGARPSAQSAQSGHGVQSGPSGPAGRAALADDDDATGSFAALLLRHEPARRCRLLQERLAGHAAGVLRLGASRLDPRSPLGSYGLNSLMAMELRNRIEADLDLPLSATALWNYPSLLALAEHLLGRLVPEGTAQALPPPVGSDARNERAEAEDRLDAQFADVQSLSDDEALAALLDSAVPARGRS